MAAFQEGNKMERNTAQLGKVYRDTLTGYQGTANAITEYLYGCRRVSLARLVENKPEEFWFDEPALEPVDVGEAAEPVQDTGGPHGYR